MPPFRTPAAVRGAVFAACLTLGCAGVTSDGDTETSTTDSGAEESGGTAALPSPDPLVAMTFNVLCSICDSTYDPWDDRVGYIADTVRRHTPDLVGLQELISGEEVQQLLDLNPGYDALYYMGESSDYADSTIWWRNDRYESVDSGFYWLSPTPDVPLSNGFAGLQLPRLVAWVHLRELATDAELLFVDTHFDNNSPSQELSAPLFLQRTESRGAGLPIVAVGDFNSAPDSPAYAILVGAAGAKGEFALTNAFDLAVDWTVDSNETTPTEFDPDDRIDHIFVAGGEWYVPSWVVDTWMYGASDLHTSDHFAMAAELHFRG